MDLYRILSSFEGGNETEDSLKQKFSKMAKELMYGGHFLVGGQRHIYLEEIEFYYHEEKEDGIKDPVMYHTNDHEGREVPYFETGRFNMHPSGVDVTFENEKGAYRASFLIRAYSVVSDSLNKSKETRSTYIYDDMFYMGVPMHKPIEIEWVEDTMDTNIGKLSLEGIGRVNVAEYEKEDGRYKKGADGKYIKQKTESKDSKVSFSVSGTRYKKCTRPWRFVKQKSNK